MAEKTPTPTNPQAETTKPVDPLHIYVLVEKIPTIAVEGVKQIINCHHELGYWKNEIHAKQIADRKALHVLELATGEVLS
jgi:hypothetical protein